MAQRILALEMDGGCVRAALAERNWNSLRLVTLVEEERANNEPDLAAALQRLLAKTGRPHVTVSALSGEFVTRRLLALPFSDRRRLEQAVPFALEEHLPFPVEDAIVAFTVVGQEEQSTLVIAVYAQKSDLREHLELLARAGIDPKTVTLSCLALAALAARIHNRRQAPYLLLNIDRATSSIVLLDPSGTPRAIRTVAAGLGLGEDPALAPAAADTIVAGARQMLLAQGHEPQAPELVVTGEAAAVPRLGRQLAQALALTPADTAHFDLGRVFAGVDGAAYRFATCLGMLTGELAGRSAELLNFRRGEFAFRGRTGDFAPFVLSAALAGAAIILLLVHVGIGIYASMQQIDLLNQQIARAAAPALGKVSGEQALTRLRAGIAQMKSQLKLLGVSFGDEPPLETLLALSQTLPPRMPAEMLDVTIDERGLHILGRAASFATVDQVKTFLSKSHRFRHIQVTEAKASSEANKVDFRLNAQPAGYEAGGS